ncbi:type IV toxin-antitoxin system AbiEi family antitoxin domain-containing protein [Leifsonia sp. H3M29-4]|uniref:type IV toxin-antitoxin system AbiEi family antitoxin domain-containing protein n=1 Tax=Salinibacterium metalliresistens TaxID=3031321 RepID=UPI0023DA2D70|nr:type IV toxin-antitoxin system AbiEi family antitoxin domain-containing protein [Salinibacterium metalliresistens]MDF1479057.1 type IV toxin-antitoxin system AbiEi family antitoxin domain-containing protein [Salinibacterium metalliresistens]
MHRLCSLGHVASTRDLLAAGLTRRELARAVTVGRALRPARGVYACPHLEPVQLTAARAGLRLDCVTALARRGVWSGIRDARLHLRAQAGRHHGAVPIGAVVHWAGRHETGEHPLEVSIVDALLQAMRCLDHDDALACIESALHLRELDERGLRRLRELAPRWMRATLARLDRGAQSGLETHARLRLQDAGHRVRTQAIVPGAGPLDLLVDECVGVETDGRQFHEATFIADRSKDITIESWGIRVLRLGSPHVFDSWPDTLAAIERMVADARRR